MRHHRSAGRLLAAILLAAFAVAPLGCGNDDPVTPHDELNWTADDVAVQVGYLTYAMVRVLPELHSKASPETDSLGPPFTGLFWKDSNPDRVWTTATEHLFWSPDDYEGVTFDVFFDISAMNSLADGTGSLVVDPLTIAFELEDVEIVAQGYPEEGQMVVDTSGWLATVTFTSAGAVVTIGDRAWDIDMDDGTTTEIIV